MTALPIVLVGPMGAGKTRIGQVLARKLKTPFIDTDARIVRLHGPIESIFAELGEAGFRSYERAVVAEALHEEAVIALGGGAILAEETRNDLRGSRVISLRVSAEILQERLAGGSRPLLPGETEESIATWKAIYEKRRELYASVATFDVDTTNRRPPVIVQEIINYLKGPV